MLTAQALKLASVKSSFERQIEICGSIGSLEENDLFEHDYTDFGASAVLQEKPPICLGPLSSSPRSVLVFGDLNNDLNDHSSPMSGTTGYNSLATSPGSCSPAESPR